MNFMYGTTALSLSLLLFCLQSTLAFASRQRFETWKEVHQKWYSSVEEEEARYMTFLESMNEIRVHESMGNKTYTLGLNKFADLKWEEFSSLYLGGNGNIHNVHNPNGEQQDCSATSYSEPRLREQVFFGDIPDSIDWREKNAVSPVKDQGSCGSCWTFSTTGALESHHYLKYGEMTILAEQQLVDCAQDFDNHGCNGGLPSHAFEYVRYNGGIDTEDSYPYMAVDQTCAFNPDNVGAKVSSSYNITAFDEDELVAAVGTVGPVSIAFQVASDFKLYTGGVYDSDVCESGPMDVNHAVLTVGYNKGEDVDAPYYIIKNSWGTDWGLDGYFWMAMDKNMCGISDCASYPIIA